ncbi:MAG: DUF6734 family protein [Bacteroidota bacterium]
MFIILLKGVISFTMKIVHSYWSKPGKISRTGFTEKTSGGWRHKKYELMSWALSCLTFKRFYPNIELVTDIDGKKLLIDQLRLPYTSIRIVLDQLNKYPQQLWAVGKLFAYSLQDEPFIHVDNDIYIWKRFKPKIEKAALVAQHVDHDETHYNFAMDHLKEHNIQIPLVLTRDLAIHKRFNSSNAGIIGGNDIIFFKEYVEKAFHFIDTQLEKISKTVVGSLYAIIYEQYLYSALARKNNIKIHHLFRREEIKSLDLVNFMNKYGNTKYVHLYSFSKFSLEYCRNLEHQLLLEYPEYHNRIISLAVNENGC